MILFGIKFFKKIGKNAGSDGHESVQYRKKVKKFP